MARFVAKYRENDSLMGEEVFVSIEGMDYGFVAVPDNGEEFDLLPSDTVEEARAELGEFFADYDTFEWID